MNGMKGRVMFAMLAAAVALAILTASARAAAGDRYLTGGADLTPAQQQGQVLPAGVGAQQVDAASSASAGPWTWVIPLLLALTLLGLLGWLLSRRHDSFILEPNAENGREDRYEHAGMRRRSRSTGGLR